MLHAFQGSSLLAPKRAFVQDPQQGVAPLLLTRSVKLSSEDCPGYLCCLGMDFLHTVLVLKISSLPAPLRELTPGFGSGLKLQYHRKHNCKCFSVYSALQTFCKVLLNSHEYILGTKKINCHEVTNSSRQRIENTWTHCTFSIILLDRKYLHLHLGYIYLNH
jgi:hypothetical protein